MIKAVIFDMDGVVVDSINYDYEAWRDTLLKLGVSISFKDYKCFTGMKGTEIVKFYAPNLSEEDLMKFQTLKENFFINLINKNGIKPVNGVLDFINSLKKKGYKVGLATAAPTDKLNAVLTALKIKNIFDAMVNADEVKKGKPHPEIFLKAADKLHVPPAESIVIEDAVNGVKAAKAGNFLCVAITTSHSAKDLKEADHIINGYGQFDWSWLK